MIKRLSIKNVANIKDATYDLGKVNVWEADNGIGKSNTLNALNFLLTGKVNTDTFQNENDFSTFIPKDDDHAVAEIEIELANGKTLGVQYYNVYQKKRGTGEIEYKGRTTDYYINGAKQTKNALFLQELNEEFGLSNLTAINIKTGSFNPYALISDVFYAFGKIDYSILRQVITHFTGEATFEELSSNHPEFLKLKPIYDKYSGKVDNARRDYKKQAEALRKDIDVLNKTIDNLSTSYDEETYNKLENERMSLEQQIHNVKNNGSDFKELEDKIRAKREEIVESKGKDLESYSNPELDNAKKSFGETEAKLDKQRELVSNIQSKVDSNYMKGRSLADEYKTLDKANELLQEQLVTASKEIEVATCPHCGLVLISDEELEAKQQERAKAISKIENKMAANAKERAEIIEQVQATSNELEALNKSLEENKAVLESLRVENTKASNLYYELANKPKKIYSVQTEKLEEELKALEEELNKAKENSESYKQEQLVQLNESLNQVRANLNPILGALANKATHEKLSHELEDKTKELNNTEQWEILCDRYCKTRIEAINSKTLETFGIQFMMLEDQVNGGLKDVCYPVVDGKPYSQMNRGLKELVGARFISSIKRLTGVKEFPLIIDNAESLGSNAINELKALDTQLFLTRVVPGLNNITFKEEE